jgi:beta-glucosidase
MTEPAQPQAFDLSPRKGMGPAEIDAVIARFLGEATLSEKVAMVSGKGFFKLYKASGKRWGADPYPAGSGSPRFAILPLYFTDGPRGVARGESTCFPCTMARGASFDTDLERRIGEAMAKEIRAQGCTLSGAVCINLLRHPAWGRAQETYGEDTCHLGEMGAALAVGLQTHNVIATVKHFALNSMENARFKVDVLCDGRALREVYLPHFKRVLDAGCASVMSAYNKWNGAYCGQNPALLTTILREEWGFTGFVHSDWVFGVYDVSGLAAGLDIENPEPVVFGQKLIDAVERGEIAEALVDRACGRILRTQYRFASAHDPLPDYPISLVASAEHRALALEAAVKSAVLLKNDAVLPLRRERLGSLAVLGRLADLANTGDNGSSRVRPPYVITPLQGLAAAAEGVAILRGDETDLPAAAAQAARADAVVVVVGYTAEEEGEYIPGDGIDLGQGGGQSGQSQFMTRRSIGGDRRSLDLPADQIVLIQAAAAAAPDKPVVVVIIAGSAVMVEAWHDQVGAILQTFYAGMEGGTALAHILFGEASPSARLPFTVAQDAGHYPFLDIDADAITYGPYAGYTHFDKHAQQPRFPFGHGLSYTRFAYGPLRLHQDGGAICAQVRVENIGPMAGDEVVLLFVQTPGQAVERPVRQLKAFACAPLAPGAVAEISIRAPLADLRWWDEAAQAWRMEAGVYRFSLLTRSGETVCADFTL